jgi:hypothetical protein
VSIDPYGDYDRDVSYWVGNVATPLNLRNVGYHQVDDRDFGIRIDQANTAGSSAIDVPITGGRVNALPYKKSS